MTPARTITVTPAQRELIDAFMFDGAEPTVIARRMGLTRGSIYNRFTKILDRAGMPNRTAFALALERGQLKLRVRDGRMEE